MRSSAITNSDILLLRSIGEKAIALADRLAEKEKSRHVDAGAPRKGQAANRREVKDKVLVKINNRVFKKPIS